MTVHRLAPDTGDDPPDAFDAAHNAETRKALIDVTERLAALLGQLDNPDRPTEEHAALDQAIAELRPTLEELLETDWAESDDPRAWNDRQRARHLLDTRDATNYDDAPGFAAAQEIIATYQARDATDKLAELVNRIIVQPGRRDALANLTDTGWTEIRSLVIATCSDRAWREISKTIHTLREEGRRAAAKARDPWTTPIPTDVRDAALQVQHHLRAGWKHADLDHFDRYGGLGGDTLYEAVLADGGGFKFANADQLNSPQRILGRLQACRITGIDPDHLKGRNLQRLAALVDAASVEVQQSAEEEETEEWLAIYTQRAGTKAESVADRLPFREGDDVYINTGDLVQWLYRGQSITTDRATLERRLRKIGARRLPEPVQVTVPGGKRASNRYWVYESPEEAP